MKHVFKILAASLVVGILMGVYQVASTNSSGANPGHTGGAGEPTCNSCHNNALNTGTITNTLTINGAAPSTYTPGTQYTIVLTPTGGVARRGFQMMALTSSNASTGTFTSGSGNRTTVGNGRTYMTHSGRFTASTTFQWTAPASNVGNITFYGITYSGNGNSSSSSQLQTSSWVITPAVVVPPTPTITADGPTTFCQGGTVELTATAASTYIWSNGETTQSITVSQTGSYTVQIANGGPLSAASLPTSVSVLTAPSAPTITSSSNTICPGRPVTLTSSSSTGNVWSNGATTSSINVTAGGIYSVQVVADGCTSSRSNQIAITSGFIVFTTIDAAFCAGTTYNFNGRILNLPGSYADTLTRTSGCDSIVQLQLSVAGVAIASIERSLCEGESFLFGGRLLTTGGLYSDTLSRGGSCDSVTNLTLLVSPIPQAPVLENVGGVLNANSNAPIYKWYKDGILIEGESNGTYSPSLPGVYTVKAVLGGCESVLSNAIIITSVKAKALSSQNFSIYPNPAVEQVSLTFKGLLPQNIALTVFNASGKTMLNLPITINEPSQTVSIETNQLPGGSYIVIGNAIEGLIKSKFIVQ